MLQIYYFFTQGLKQILILPIWWYSQGLNTVATRLADRQIIGWRRLSLGLWLKHLFTPMFHDYTIIGRGLSLVLRVIIIFIRTINLLGQFAFKILLLTVYLVLPVLVVAGLVMTVLNL